METLPEMRKCHLVYARDNGRLHLVGYGHGEYIAKATQQHPTIFTVNCEEWKYGENDFRYENKEITISHYYD